MSIGNQTSLTFPFDFIVSYANTETNERFEKRMTGTVTITATGDVERSQTTEVLQNQQQRTSKRSKGSTRDATVTLDAKLDGVPQSLPITSGEIGTVTNGDITITHN
jgi:hypothetical protein